MWQLCGYVCCGLWVPLMWSVCGCRCYNPLPGLEGVSEWVCESIERSGRGSCVFCGLWVPLMWSVCGRGLPWSFLPLADVYCLRVCVISEVGMAALCGCVSCGMWVPLMWSMCGRGLQWALQPLAGVYWPGERV